MIRKLINTILQAWQNPKDSNVYKFNMAFNSTPMGSYFYSLYVFYTYTIPSGL